MNCLITQTGKRIDCDNGQTHEVVCKHKLGIPADRFLLKQGGIRVKVCWPDSETIAIEYYHRLTEKQENAIKKILRENDYYAIILNMQVITKFRPIRSFDFSGCLVLK